MFVKGHARGNRTYGQSTWGGVGRYNGTDVIIPVEIGVRQQLFALKRGQVLYLMLTGRRYYSRTDQLDTYIPDVEANKSKDSFDAFFMGLIFKF